MKHTLLPLIFCISMGASCQTNDNTRDGVNPPNMPKVIYKGTSVLAPVGIYDIAPVRATPKANPIKFSISGAIGRTDLFYPHGNSFDPFSVSLEIAAANKLGYVQFRQSFMEDQPVYNNYANPGRNHLAWIEQLAVHANIFKVGDFTTTGGAAIQYQWGDVSTKLTKWRWFPELGFSYNADERFAWIARTSWFHYKPEHRLGFMGGFRYQISKK